jgi:hypothetical protein
VLPIEALLLDCLLPNANLLDVLARAREGSIAAVLMSGDPNRAQAVDPTLLFLLQPFSPATLWSVLVSARR